MQEYTYSITISHYNNISLLKRMLKSIPERDDIQIIVVDDYSTFENKEKLKSVYHKNLEIYYQPSNQGAANARNEGVKYATGKWLLAVDCDDMFVEGAFDILDHYKDEDVDYLSYCISCRNAETLEAGTRIEKANSSVLSYIQKPCKKNLKAYKFNNTDTWNKMVSLRFIHANKIHWEENCRVNVDVLYSYLIALKAKTSMIIPDVIYWFVGAPNSITRKERTIAREFQFYLAAQKRNGLFEKLGFGYPYYRHDLLYVVFMLQKRGFKGMIDFFKYKHQHNKEVKEARMKFKYLLNDYNPEAVLSLENNRIVG